MSNENDAGSTSEVMAADSKKVRKPRNSPALWPFLQLPRRTRAEFLRGLQRLTTASEKVQSDRGAGLDEAASAYDLMAEAEDLLRLAATDADEFATWLESASDDALMALLQWYMDRFQVGEAPASPS